MTEDFPMRPNEMTADVMPATDASLTYIGHIETPWTRPEDCPRQGDSVAGPDCALVVAPPWLPALTGIDAYPFLDILYWMHLSRRDLILQNPDHGDAARGTFSLRSPIRPNPIGLSNVRLIGWAGNRVTVRGLECVSGTPLLDIKPDRRHFTPPSRDRAGGQTSPEAGG
ncbi:SAM-dependent methyltransferase [Roseicyclus marinus]|uniref:SAM-dependent methyltransferase n=1 Tax=Roseicyclus marinus TaxID=2161673 RepID=UPI0024102A23|nr:SAM-dependent methyltransferase [Roseicyclus marinus]MDG3041270.1 SAM-dependent methyltransferase [Roseicyclus marinus]